MHKNTIGHTMQILYTLILAISLIVPLRPDANAVSINDFSRLNKTMVHKIIKVTSQADIRNALVYAKKHGYKVCAAGACHSQGGHAFYKNAVILDMKAYNKIIALNKKEKTIWVQSGATWKQIQDYLHPHKLAVCAMQSSNIFTIGGSISVNAHGMDHRFGAVANSICSFTIMMADGTIRFVTKKNDPTLFKLVVGGYGLFGIILDVQLTVTENRLYERDIRIIPHAQFLNCYQTIRRDYRYELCYGHLSTAPQNFLKDMVVYSYYRAPQQNRPIPKLKRFDPYGVGRIMFNYLKITPFLMQQVKWQLETGAERLGKLFGLKTISRNQVMYDSVEYLDRRPHKTTDILQEYYVPHRNFTRFINTIRPIIQKHAATLLNASVRIVHKEDITLTYAPQDMFAIVLYFNQSIDTQSHQDMKCLTKRLIRAALAFDGTFFLPYQLHYTAKNLVQAYPAAEEFFTMKRKYDPQELFMNSFYATYRPRP